MTVYFLEAFFSFCKVSLFLLLFLSSFFRITFTFYLSRLFIYNWLELLLLCDFISCRTRSLFDSFMNIVEILDNNRKLLKILDRPLKKTYKSIFSNVVKFTGWYFTNKHLHKYFKRFCLLFRNTCFKEQLSMTASIYSKHGIY